MDRRTSHLLPLSILAIIALVSFVLQSVVNLEGRRNDAKRRHEPDAMAENFVVVRYDEAGRLKYRLTGPYSEHYPDDDSSLIHHPYLLAYREHAAPMTLSSQRARVTSRGQEAFLTGDVHLVRPGIGAQPPLDARMPDLAVQIEAGTAHTDSPVHITQGRSVVDGVGMDLDNNASTMVLRSQVVGLIYPSKGQP